MAVQTQIQQATMKDPKKVETGKRLAVQNRRKREEHAQPARAQSESNITYYGTGAVVAIGVVITFTNPGLLKRLRCNA